MRNAVGDCIHSGAVVAANRSRNDFPTNSFGCLKSQVARMVDRAAKPRENVWLHRSIWEIALWPVSCCTLFPVSEERRALRISKMGRSFGNSSAVLGQSHMSAWAGGLAKAGLGRLDWRTMRGRRFNFPLLSPVAVSANREGFRTNPR
jgi:hypothetical protein